MEFQPVRKGGAARVRRISALVLAGYLPISGAVGAETGKETKKMDDFKLEDNLAFSYGNTLAGKVRGGEEHGVELSRGFDGKPVIAPASLNLEHYYSTSRPAGLFVPRKGTRRIEKTGDRTVRVEIAEYAGWKISAEIIYTFLPDCAIRADYTLVFGETYQDFNTILSLYFFEETMPCLRFDNRWEQLRLATPKEHRFWCRDAKELERFKRALPAMNADYAPLQLAGCMTVDQRTFSTPIMISAIRDTGWAVILWFDEEVRSVSANTRWKAHDFSIGGRDVKKGEVLKSTVWLAYRQLDNMDATLKGPGVK